MTTPNVVAPVPSVLHSSFGKVNPKARVVAIDLDTDITKAIGYRFENAFADGTTGNVKKKFSDDARTQVIADVLSEIQQSRELGISAERVQGAHDILLAINTRWGSFLIYSVMAYKGDNTPPQEIEMISFRAPNKDSGAVCLPVTADGNILLVRQWRFQLNRFTIELPRGFMRKGETMEECALREAQEETGLIVERGVAKVHDLGTISPNSGILQEEPHLFAVTGVEVGTAPRPDSTESIIGKFVAPVDEVRRMIHLKQINCGFTLSAMLRAEYAGIFPNIRS